MSIMRLQVTVYYANGTAMVQPHPHRDDVRGRKDTDEKAFRLLNEPKVRTVKVTRTNRVAQTGRKSYR